MTADAAADATADPTANARAASLPVLLVDDEVQLLHSASIVLRTSGVAAVHTLSDSREVLALLARQPMGVLVLDLAMPHVSGQVLLAQVAAAHPELPVILMTATNDLDTAVQCMQAGAIDYLVKPVEKNRLVSAVKRALEIRALNAEVLALKEHLLADTLRHPEAFAQIVTRSKSMHAIFRYLEAIAPSPQPVLVTGETGTGKELIARALHRLSGRAGELVAVNVAGLDDAMFSDTLFGHAKGAYSGADRLREGLINTAGEGTLFLDEIGDLGAASQVKLLRLLQDGSFYPLGADRPRQCRARVVVATNCHVVKAVEDGSFRRDLYFRLRTHHLNLPPLRARLGDLPLLVDHCVEKAARALNKPVPSVPAALCQLLRTYAFPGNVRELEAMVFDALARHEGSVLSLQSFKNAISGKSAFEDADALPHSTPSPIATCFPEQLPTLEQAEDALIDEALHRAEGNQGVAASLLGISRQALNKRLARRRDADA
jgi:two-component system, NtrC family, nitrogen regulation response regulator GlnG